MQAFFARLARLCQGKPCGSLWTGLCLWLASSNGYAKASPVVPCGPGLSLAGGIIADLSVFAEDVLST